jgi:DNA-binding transcriptional MerR regulator
MVDPAGVRIETAAQLTGLSTRNIRAYQSLGLLPRPRLTGRIGRYEPSHLGRLRTIGRLQAQGFSLAGIKVLFDAHDRGVSLDGVLGMTPGVRDDTFWTAAGPAPRALRLALVPAPLASTLGPFSPASIAS